MNFNETDRIAGMKDITMIRRENLRAVSDRLGGESKLVKATGRSDQQINQLIGKTPTGSFGSTLARNLETELELEPHWLDNDHSSKFDPELLAESIVYVDSVISEDMLNCSEKARAYGIIFDYNERLTGKTHNKATVSNVISLYK